MKVINKTPANHYQTKSLPVYFTFTFLILISLVITSSERKKTISNFQIADSSKAFEFSGAPISIVSLNNAYQYQAETLYKNNRFINSPEQNQKLLIYAIYSQIDTVEANKQIKIAHSKDFNSLMNSLYPFFLVDSLSAHQFYKLHTYLFSQGKPHVHVREIVLSDFAIAQSLYKKILDGASFSALAEQYSTDPINYRENGGDLGWVTLGGSMPQAWDQTALSLKANQVSNIIKIQSNNTQYCILQAIDSPSIDIIPYDYVRPSVQIIASQILQYERFTQWLTQKILLETFDYINPQYRKVLQEAVTQLRSNPAQDFGSWL